MTAPATAPQADAAPCLTATRARLLVASPHPLPLPRFSGSAWRGAFGHALKRTVCAMRLRPCEGCPLAATCPFPLFFPLSRKPDDEAAPGDAAGAAARDAAVPASFVLCPDETPRGGAFPPGAPVGVTLRLFGAANRTAAYALAALQRAAQDGVGPARRELHLLALGQEDGPSLPTTAAAFQAAATPSPLPAAPPVPHLVRIQLVSPTRLRVQADLVTPARFTPAHLFGALVRRVAVVGRLQDGDGGPHDLRALRDAATRLTWKDARWGWVETTRASSRQQARLQMGGIVGEGGLDLRGAPELWPYLWAGQWLHVGKAASMGFGRLLITA